jgi:hypothetical protein
LTGRSSAVFRVVWTPPTRVGAAMDPGDGAFIGDRRISRRNVPRGRRAVSRNRTPSLHRVGCGPAACWLWLSLLGGEVLDDEDSAKSVPKSLSVGPLCSAHARTASRRRAQRQDHAMAPSEDDIKTCVEKLRDEDREYPRPRHRSRPSSNLKTEPWTRHAIPRPRHLTRPPTPTFSSTPLQCGWKPRRSS